MIKILLSSVMGKRRMTQAELARRTGIRPNTINDMYNEFTTRVNLEHLDKICRVLNCTLCDILEWSPDEENSTPARRT